MSHDLLVQMAYTGEISSHYSLSITLAFSTQIITCKLCWHSRFIQDEPFWKEHMDAGLQNKFLLSLWPGQKSASILLSPIFANAAFPSLARDRCFTRLAKMRRNTVTFWTTADFVSRETCSFIRLNDAFRKTFAMVKSEVMVAHAHTEPDTYSRTLLSSNTIFLQHTIYFITLLRLSSPVLKVT